MLTYTNTYNDHAPAIVWLSGQSPQSLSYHQLKIKVQQRVDYLKQRCHLQEGDTVAVMATRGPEYIVNMFALWELGAIYMPLSQNSGDTFNLERIKQAEAKYVIAEKHLILSLEPSLDKLDVKCIDIDSAQEFASSAPTPLTPLKPAGTVDANRIAYLFSTSGTTGSPKLIEIPFAAIADRVNSEIHCWKMQANTGQDGILGFIGFDFDASVNEVILATLTGNALYIVPEEVRKQSYQGIPDFLARFPGKITTAILLPSVLKGLYAKYCSSINKLLTMGQKCLLQDLKEKGWFDQADILEGYGGTETGFGASVTPLSRDDSEPDIKRVMVGLILYLMETFHLQLYFSEEAAKYAAVDAINEFILYPVNQHWQYDLKDLTGTHFQGELPDELKSACDQLVILADIKNADTKTKNEVKAIEHRLMSALIDITVKHPRYILKFQLVNNKLLTTTNPQFAALFQAAEETLQIRGELYVGGSGIGRYRNNPEKNSEKFFEADAAASWGLAPTRVFRSGDIALYRQGKLVYMNRNDREVKRYGILISLDDIEELLRECPHIESAAVMQYETGSESIIVAFLVPKNKLLFTDDAFKDVATRETLNFIDKSGRLEDKHKPNCCFFVPEIPTSDRNKTSYQLSDYVALKPIRLHTIRISTEDESLIRIAKIWQELLEGDLHNKLKLFNDNAVPYPLDVTFNELGGDSLLISAMIEKIWREFINQETPAPNDFASAIQRQATLKRIVNFIVCYTHQPVKLIHQPSPLQGLPHFVLLSPEIKIADLFKKYLSYQLIPAKLAIIPEHFESLIANLLEHLLKTQKQGPFHLVSDTFYFPLMSSLALKLSRSEKVFLTCIGMREHQQLEIPHSMNLTIEFIEADALEKQLDDITKRQSDASVQDAVQNYQQHYLSEQRKFSLTPYQPPLALTQLQGFISTASTAPNIGESWPTRVVTAATSGGKSRLLYEILHSATTVNSYLIIPLNLAGLKGDQLLTDALQAQLNLTSWQLLALQQKPLILLLDNYDALARYDCPPLWNRQHTEGFSNLIIVIACRTHHWRQQSATTENIPIFELAPLEIDLNDERISSLDLPRCFRTKEVLEILRIKVDATSSLTVWRYEFLKAWLAKEHERGTLKNQVDTPAALLQITIDTLSYLYFHFQKPRGAIPLHLHTSHWEVIHSQKIPTPHPLALPGLTLIYDFLRDATLPATWSEEIRSHAFTPLLQQDLSIEKALGLTDVETAVLQQQAQQSFWQQLSADKINPARVVPLQHHLTRPALFLLYPLTGDIPIAYRELAQLLGKHIPIYAIKMANEDFYDPAHANIKTKAIIYKKIIEAIQPEGPYHFIAWSFGVSLAIELTLLFEEDGQQVDFVINIDCPPPSFIPTLPQADMTLSLLQKLFNDIYKIKLDVASLTHAGEHSANKNKAYFENAREQLSRTHTPQSKRLLQVIHNAEVNQHAYYDFATQFNPSLKKIRAKLFVFEASVKTRHLNEADFSAWQSICESPIAHTPYPSDHFNFLVPEVLTVLNQVVAGKFQPTLNMASIPARLRHYANLRLQAHERREQHHPLQANYVAAKAGDHLITKEELQFNLEETLDTFYQAPTSADLFLLLGEPGVGKSLSLLREERKLLVRFLKNEGRLFPLFITVKYATARGYVEQALLNIGLTSDEIAFIRREIQEKGIGGLSTYLQCQLIILFDRLDEAFVSANLYDENELSLWGARAIISSRTHVPSFIQQQRRSTQGELAAQIVYLQAFNLAAITAYLHHLNKNPSHYRGIITHPLDIAIVKQPHVQALLKTPLLLALAVQIWDVLPQVRTRLALYNVFISKTYGVYQHQSEQQEGIRRGVDLMLAYRGYNQYQATRLISTKAAITDPIHVDEIDNRDMQQVKVAAWFSEVDGMVQFTHATFWEYHFAKQVAAEILEHDFTAADYPPLLGRCLFTHNYSLLNFLKELYNEFTPKQKTVWIQNLFLFLDASRTIDSDPHQNHQRVLAASHAFTLLNDLRIIFSTAMLQGIRAPFANLREGIFDSAELSGAVLDDVTWQNAWLRGTRLSASHTARLQFGERPFLQFGKSILGYFPAANGEFKLILTDGAEEKIYIYSSSEHVVTELSFSLPNKQLTRKICLGSIGRFIAFADTSNEEVFLWSLVTQQLIYKFKLINKQRLVALALSHDEKTLAIATHDGNVILIHTENFDTYYCRANPSRSIYSVTFDPEAKLIASHHPHDGICIWHVDDKSVFTVLTENKPKDNTGSFSNSSGEAKLVFSPNHIYVAAVAEEVQLWSIAEKKIIHCFNSSDNTPAHCALFSKDNRTIVIGFGKHILVFDITTGNLLARLAGHSQAVTFLSYDHTNVHLMSGSEDGTLRFWNQSSWDKTFAFNVDLSSIDTSALSPDSTLLAVARRGMVTLWRTRSYQKICNFRADKLSISALAFSLDGESLAVAGQFRITIQLFKVSELLKQNFLPYLELTGDYHHPGVEKQIISINEHAYGNGGRFSTRFLAFFDDFVRKKLSGPETVKHFQAYIAEHYRGSNFHPGYYVSSICVTREAVVAIHSDGSVHSWPLQAPSTTPFCSAADSTTIPYQPLEHAEHSVYIHMQNNVTASQVLAYPNHKHFLLTMHNLHIGNSLMFFNPFSTMKYKILAGRDSRHSHIARSPLSHSALNPIANILFVPDSNTINLINVVPGSSLNIIASLQGHRQAISHLSLSADFKYLASADSTPALWIWDTDARQCVCRIDELPAAVTRIHWGSDTSGLFFIMTSSDNIIRSWRLIKNEPSQQITAVVDWVSHQVSLFTAGSDFSRCFGLEAETQTILQQHGARIETKADAPGQTPLAIASTRFGFFSHIATPDNTRILGTRGSQDKLSPEDEADKLLEEAKGLFDDDDEEMALIKGLRAHELNPHSSEICDFLANAYWIYSHLRRENLFNTAKEYFEKKLKLDNSLQSKFYFALFLFQRGAFEEAIVFLEDLLSHAQVARLDSEDSFFSNNYIFAGLNKVKLNSELFKKLRDVGSALLFSPHALIYYLLIAAYHAVEKPQLALPLLNEFAEFIRELDDDGLENPQINSMLKGLKLKMGVELSNDALSYFLIACSYRLFEKYDAARKALEHALALEPSFTAAQVDIADINSQVTEELDELDNDEEAELARALSLSMATHSAAPKR